MSLKADIQRLAHERPGVAKLEDATDPAPILDRVAVSSVGRATGSGTGIASPLVEQDYTARTWHADQAYISSDGVFTFYFAPIASIIFQDAAGQQVTMEYAEPPT